MTETGSRQYKVDVAESQKDLSQISRERSLHSVICSEKQLSPMTLNQTRADSLQTQHILARIVIEIVTIDLENRILYRRNRTVNLFLESKFVVYLGERCEIEVSGFLFYIWWSVRRYHFFPFGVIVGTTLRLTVSLIYLFRVRKHLFKTQSECGLLVEKLNKEEEKLEELESIQDQYVHRIKMEQSDAREKDMLLKDLEPKSRAYEGQTAELKKAKELLGTKSLIYKLSPILTFDVYGKTLECNEEIISLNLQSYTLLLVFLNVTNCQLTRKEIGKCLSGGIRECFRTAKHCLVKVLQADPSISIVQHSGGLSQLQLPETEVL